MSLLGTKGYVQKKIICYNGKGIGGQTTFIPGSKPLFRGE
jgi:hypothetical protein